MGKPRELGIEVRSCMEQLKVTRRLPLDANKENASTSMSAIAAQAGVRSRSQPLQKHQSLVDVVLGRGSESMLTPANHGQVAQDAFIKMRVPRPPTRKGGVL